MNTADWLLRAGSPDAPAVIEPDGECSYAQLRSAVATLGEQLAALELPAGSTVVLLMPNGWFWVAAYLAVLALGLVAVPVAVSLTTEEVVARMQWLGCRAAFLGRIQVRTVGPALPSGVSVIAEPVRPRPREGGVQGASVPGRRSSVPALRFRDTRPDEDAVHVFTSGTTGEPRVVRLTHGNLRANTESILSFVDLRSDDRMFVVLPFTYVFGASLLHTHLRAGASLVIQPDFVFPESVVEQMVAHRVTGLAGVPSTFHLLLRNSSFRSRPIPTLRSIQQAGGKLSPVLIRELVAAQPHARVFVMYGQTEATARLSYLPPDEVLTRIGSIGRGIPGVQLRVVREDGTVVRPGEIGEIRASGANISPGYLNNPEATDRKMRGGELRTGDLARVDADGYLYVVDRAEDFIKSWGIRIASQDIESAAMALPDLIAAVAIGVPDDVAGERVELIAVKRPGSPLTESEVLQHLRVRLAKHMLPQAIHFADRLPLNANGKVSKAGIRSVRGELAGYPSGIGRPG